MEAEIDEMELNLKQKHEYEVREFKEEEAAPQPTEEQLEELKVSAEVDEAHKYENKSKKKKNKKMEAFEESRRQAVEEAKSLPNWRLIEDESIEKLAQVMKKKIVTVAADGHCLYYSVSRQLASTGSADKFDHKKLRSLAAGYMREHQEDFLPFLENKSGDMMNQGILNKPYLKADEFEAYCTETEFGAIWAGQNEVRSLPMTLRFKPYAKY